MKLQNLVIIFIIIIIPIVSIFTLYLNLETKTIRLQTDYDAKLIEATKEAMNAFEINTTEWNNEYSLLANSKRQDLLSSINVFTTSLSNKLGIGGTSKETILTYIPAMVFIMYDGYYIYAPTYVPQTITNNNGVQLFYYKDSGSEGAKITASATQNIGGVIVSGEPIYYYDSGVVGAVATGTTAEGEAFTTNIEYAQKTYKHVLKTFVPYTTTYGDYTINYTLDNYIRIYGENIKKEGYIIDDFYNGGSYRITVPANSISGIKFDGKEILPEVLTENVPVRNSMNEVAQIETYPYIYNSNNDKRYYDSNTNKYFTINKNYIRVDLPETTVGTTIAEYKKVLVRINTIDSKFIELYQLLNGIDDTWYYIDSTGEYKSYDIWQPTIAKNQDCSAINYYVEAYEFNRWLNSTSSGLASNDVKNIINNKNQEIINNINTNLNLSMSNYTANSKIDYKLPELTDEDWEQALSNISMITFFQGAKIGLKTYNNYVVVSSTQNNEYVSENSLYYMDSDDEYYHRYGCSLAQSNIGLDGVYRSTDFKIKSYTYKIDGADDYLGYYYKHATINAGGTNSALQECFDCIVNRNNFVENITNYEQAFYTAIARERYVQIQRTRLTDSNATVYELEELEVLNTISTSGDSKTVALNITGGSGHYTINWKYRVSIASNWLDDSSTTNQTIYTNNKKYDIQYIVTDTVTGETVNKQIITEELRIALMSRQTIETDTEKIWFVVTGGTAPYKYQVRLGYVWDDAVTLSSTSFAIEITSGQSKTIKVFDSAGNTVEITVTGN